MGEKPRLPHSHPTPRIGGLAVLAGLGAAAVLLPPETSVLLLVMCLSLLPIVAAGLMEDLGHHVRPRWRLLAACAASAIAILVLGITLPRADLPGLDAALGWVPFAWAFTIFACAGLSNAFNLIDGLNGLSAGVGIVCAIGLAAIAVQTGHDATAEMYLMLIAALTGFLAFNYPWGRVFLGDAGAYALGHLLAWFAILLMVHVPDLSAWAVLLIFFWPVADTFFAIYRRHRAGRPADTPDRLHFHQLVMRGVEITLVGRRRRSLANPLATLMMAPLFTLPVVMGVWLWDAPGAAFIALCLCAVIFVLIYQQGMRFARKSRGKWTKARRPFPDSTKGARA